MAQERLKNSSTISLVKQFRSTPLPFIIFETQMIKLTDLVNKNKLSTTAAFSLLLNNPILFSKMNQAFQLSIDWPFPANLKNLNIKGSIKNTLDGKKLYHLDVYQNDKLIFSIFCKNDKKVSIDIQEKALSDSDWTFSKIEEIFSNFNQLLRVKKVSYQTIKKPHFKSIHLAKEKMDECIEKFSSNHISYRIQKIILDNAYKLNNDYTFYLNWPSSINQSHLLKVNFSRTDQFYPPTATTSGYSWVLTENSLYQFPVYQKYRIPLSQYFYKMNISEVIQKENHPILDLWLTLDGEYGELHNIKKGAKINGNEILKIYHYFDDIFKIKNTFICDVASLDDVNHNIQIPLRLISSLAYGKTWYESKLCHVTLFEHPQFKTAHDGPLEQNNKLRQQALQELQSLPLNNWYKMLPQTERIKLLELYQKYLSHPPITRRSLRLTFKGTTHHELFEDTATIKDLTFSMVEKSKTHTQTLVDLKTLVTLLGGYEENSPCQNDDDYWVKSRTKIITDAIFWLKTRYNEAATTSFHPELLNKRAS